MTGRITAIVAQKKNKQRANVFIEGRYAFSVSMTTAAALHVGTDLDEAAIETIRADDQKEQAFQSGLHYLKFRPRSRMEMIRHLKRKGFVPAAVDSAIHRLESCRYIDDAAFTQFWIESRCRHRPRGAFGLRCELREKGVADEIIDDGLKDFDENKAAWRAVWPKLQWWAELPELELKEKIYRFLKQRGFGYSTCETVFEKADAKNRTPDTPDDAD